jgi:hypothetical protein
MSISKEEAKKLYDGKFFYEIVKSRTVEDSIQLLGPYNNIYYATSDINSQDEKTNSIYKFVQVIDGKIIQAFTEWEILVTDRKL